MTLPIKKDSDIEKVSILDTAYSGIGETYTWLKDNVTGKLSSYLCACGEAIAPHRNTEDTTLADTPLIQEAQEEMNPDATEESSTEINMNGKKGKKKKKQEKKKGKKKKK